MNFNCRSTVAVDQNDAAVDPPNPNMGKKVESCALEQHVYKSKPQQLEPSTPATSQPKSNMYSTHPGQPWVEPTPTKIEKAKLARRRAEYAILKNALRRGIPAIYIPFLVAAASASAPSNIPGHCCSCADMYTYTYTYAHARGGGVHGGGYGYEYPSLGGGYGYGYGYGYRGTYLPFITIIYKIR